MKMRTRYRVGPFVAEGSGKLLAFFIVGFILGLMWLLGWIG